VLNPKAEIIDLAQEKLKNLKKEMLNSDRPCELSKSNWRFLDGGLPFYRNGGKRGDEKVGIGPFDFRMMESR